MRRSTVRFDNGRGALLDGRLELPVGPPRGAVLFAHCFTCGKDLPAAEVIADAFIEAGIAVLRFDFTGIGRSEGDHAETSFVTQVEDLEAAAGALRDLLGRCDALLGHSLGGAAVLQAAGRIEDVRAVVTVGAPAEPGHASPSHLPTEGDIVTAHASMNHVAFNIPADKVDEYHRKLVEAGVDCTPVVNHDESETQASPTITPTTFVRSIYFKDPDGILLEFAAWTRALTEDDVNCEPVSVEDIEAAPAG